MKNETLEEILRWSFDRPVWQRDALRRLFTSSSFDGSDLDDLVELCKMAHGLSPTKSVQPLSEGDIGSNDTVISGPVSLVGVKHHSGVNALAPEQGLTFGDHLTIVFGWNAAGKSGYARILKKACRSRAAGEILGNVLSEGAPLKAQATIRFREGEKETTFLWKSDIPAANSLSAVSVFDSQCAPVYLGQKTDVAFRPFGLDIFDKLSEMCGEVKKRLEVERSKLETAIFTPPKLTEGTRVKKMVDALTSLTNPEEIKALAALSEEETNRLRDLRNQHRDFQTADPRKLFQELLSKAKRVLMVAEHVAAIADTFSHGKLADFRASIDSLRVKREALSFLREKTLAPDLLPGTGEDLWRTMWEAAGKFFDLAYPGLEFPAVSGGARCPLCQQGLGHDAVTRLEHLKEYITSEAQTKLLQAEDAFKGQVNVFDQLVVNRKDIDLVIDELNVDDPTTVKQTRDFLQSADLIQKQIRAASTGSSQLPIVSLAVNPETNIRQIEKGLKDRAAKVQKQDTAFDPKTLVEFNDLNDRLSLAESLQIILKEVKRKQQIAAYGQAIEDTATQAITRKSTELTKRLVTDQLHKSFKDELKKLEFAHLDVDIRPAGGMRGALFHQLVFSNAPGVVVPDVLSEGESRVLSLAAFLSELSTATSHSTIIFDDPVSSLDHRWRERIARRLVEEANNRQVIVFTHDLLFFRVLVDEATNQGIGCEHQYVERDKLGAGVSSANLPWVAMRVKERIGVLRRQYQEAEKVFRTKGTRDYESYASNIYGHLRETWEQAISEVLLADIIERYRPSIETKKVRYLHDISEADCTAVDEGMTDCSRWMVGHDQPVANGTPFPSPEELNKRIVDLDNWVKAIQKRRK